MPNLKNPVEAEAMGAVQSFDQKLIAFEEVGSAIQEVRNDSKRVEKKAQRRKRTELNKIAGKMIGNGCPRVLAHFCSQQLQHEAAANPAFAAAKDLQTPCSMTCAGAKPPAFVKQIIESLEANDEKLKKKSDNLKAKMKGKVALTSVAIEKGVETLQDDDIDLQVPATSMALFGRPFLVAAEVNSWTWDLNAWPLPGVPCFVVGVDKKKVLIMAVKLEALKAIGASALTALDNFFLSKGDEKDLLSRAGAISLTLCSEDVIWIPCGWVPLTIVLEDADADSATDQEKDKNSDKGVVAVIPTLQDKALAALTQPAALDIKHYIDALSVQMGATQTWSMACRLAQAWVEPLGTAVAAAKTT